MKSAIALGFFDGVHSGHAALLNKTLEIASSEDLSPCVITYDRHPSQILSCDSSVKLINTLEERVYLIRRYFNIHNIVTVPFDRTLAAMDWKEYTDILIHKYNAGYFICGYDHRFGYKGLGDAEALKAYCTEIGIGCEIIPPILSGDDKISSTLIRSELQSGNIEKVNDLLGHPYTLLGTAIHGKGIGHQQVVPTVNIEYSPDAIIPKYGVYASTVTINGTVYHSITNIGIRPTFDDGQKLSCETNILNFEGDLYGMQLVVEFYHYIRPEIKFPDSDALKAQIQEDIEMVNSYWKA